MAAEDRLVQALRNVVDNGASSSLSGRIRASLARHGGQAVVCIDDEGPGIRPNIWSGSSIASSRFVL